MWKRFGLSINLINHSNYQELYEINGSSGENATFSIYYNNKGQFKMPNLMKSTPKEFGEELINLLKSENQNENTYLTLENYYNLVKKLKLDKKILLMTTIYDAVYLSVDISISDDYIENLLKKHFEIEYFNGVTFKIDISKGNNMKEV